MNTNSVSRSKECKCAAGRKHLGKYKGFELKTDTVVSLVHQQVVLITQHGQEDIRGLRGSNCSQTSKQKFILNFILQRLKLDA